MADRFFPQDFDAVATPPNITVATTLYVIRATICNPDTNTDVPLPNHVWLLVNGSGSGAKALSRSTPSDSNGTCSLSGPATLPPGSYSFFFLPFPDQAPGISLADAKLIRDGYRNEKEAWIDLDHPNVWAVPPTPNTIERRRLLRVPAWSTIRKALLGGFKVVPPGATLFASKGILLQPEIQQFGIPTPWDMPLDFNWVRARVKFSFFDWQQNQEQVLPPGLIIEARRDPTTNPQGVVIPGTTRVGAGVSASAKDGTCYLLLEGDKTLWKECHIQFHTPGACFIDLSSKATPKPDTRLQNGPLPKLPDDFNRLPSDWHSHGMRASFTTSPRATPAAASPPTNDKVWDQLHFDLSVDQNGDTTTINFHLDDVVICNKDGRVLKLDPNAKPPTLLDHFLKVIKPDTANAPYQTLTSLVGRVIPAEAAYVVGATPGAGSTSALPQSTRLVHFESGFYDLRDDRIVTSSDKIGQVLCVGARAAKEKQHPSTTVSSPLQNPGNPNADLGLQMHVIDVPGVADPATGIQLQHLLLYVPVSFGTDPINPPTSPATISDARTLLNNAAELWSPGHPGSQAVTTKKRYALIPSDTTKRGQSITRIRTFFAESSKNAQLTILLTRDTTPLKNSRSFTNAGKITFDTTSIFFPDPPVVTPTRIVLFDTAVTSDKGASGGGGDLGDGVTSPFLTLAHELGHAVHGLVDEYVEELDTGAAFGAAFRRALPFLPSFAQIDEGFSDWRPYYSDAASMLVLNNVPRLRHFWHHTKNLNDNFKSTLRDGPYDLIHETFQTGGGPGLTYNVPPSNDKAPWLPIFKVVQIPNGHGQVALFALGEDEGTVEAIFRPLTAAPSPPGLAAPNRMQGLLIVRSRICFILDSAMTPKEQFDVVKTNFQLKIYDANYAPKIRFLLVPQGTPTPALARIAVLFQPHYSINPADIKNADVIFDISKTATPPRPNPFLTQINNKRRIPVQVMATDFTFELAWRAVLGVPTFLPGGTAPDRGVIRGSDLAGVARLLEQGLGEPSGFRQVQIFA